MAIWCLGSINVDHFYSVPHIPTPGETLAATSLRLGLGGKGANQSVAASKAGAQVNHIGAVGPASEWIVAKLQEYGVKTDHIATLDAQTGHAIINVADDGENAIVTLAGANVLQSEARLKSALSAAAAGDILLLQNETNMQVEAAKIAKELGLQVMYSAAPFDVSATLAVSAFVDTLLLNEIEARQYEEALGLPLASLPIANIVVTLGAQGARWLDTRTGVTFDVPGIRVTAVDTTGAGDTFAGYLACAIDKGLGPRDAMSLAVKAGSLKVTRRGTADAVPVLAEVESFTG